MIKIEKTEIVGLASAIRGMRNPMNSWDKSDSYICSVGINEACSVCEARHMDQCHEGFIMGNNDFELMLKLAKAGSVHAKYRRMITAYVDITAPLYWWKEFDTYKVGTVANSCSTMHKIHDKEFTLDDFSCEHLLCNDDTGACFDYPCVMRNSQNNNELINGECVSASLECLKHTIDVLNTYRHRYIKTQNKLYWWQMIQLLPSSYNQKRTVMLNYEVLSNIYNHRREHKLDEWQELCKWIKTLPYSKIITLERDDDDDDDE